MRVKNKKSFFIKLVSIELKNRVMLQRIYETEKGDRNITFTEFRKEITLKIKDFKSGNLEKRLSDSLKTLLQNNGKDILKISISTKSNKYIDLYKLFITYNMLYMFQGLDALEKELQKTFNIKIEAK